MWLLWLRVLSRRTTRSRFLVENSGALHDSSVLGLDFGHPSNMVVTPLPLPPDSVRHLSLCSTTVAGQDRRQHWAGVEQSCAAAVGRATALWTAGSQFRFAFDDCPLNVAVQVAVMHFNAYLLTPLHYGPRRAVLATRLQPVACPSFFPSRFRAKWAAHMYL